MINGPKDVNEEVPLNTTHISKIEGQPVKLSVADKTSSNKWPKLKKNTDQKNPKSCFITLCGFKCAPHSGAQRQLEVSFA